jgi:peptide/nickel transport system substrate-binding protein
MEKRKFNLLSLIMMGLVIMALAACVPTTTTETAKPAAEEETAEEPATAKEAMAEETEAEEGAYGGSVVIGTTDDIINFDAFSLGFVSYPMQNQCYDSLILYDHVLNIKPRLATEWEVNEDGTQLTLQLRQGVKWHNDREFVADDVVKNFERALVPDTGSNVHGMVQTVTGAEALDDHTVVINFSAPTPNMFDILNAMRIMAPESFDTLDQTCIGTGPFKFQEWIPGDHLTFARNEDYWEEGRPFLDEVTFKPFDDLEALVTALETGIIDGAIAVPPKDYQRLLDAGIEVPFGQTGALLYSITVNPPDPDQPEGPLSDKRVRQAICYSIDREATVDQALFGVGGATVVPFPEYSIAYFPEYADFYQFDLDKAAALLDEAGWVDTDGDSIRDKDGQSLVLNTITIQAFPETTDMAQILKADMSQIGVELDIEPLDSATYTPRHLGTAETNNSAVFDLDVTFVGRQHLDPMGLFDNSPYRPRSSPIFPQGDFPEGYVENLKIAGSTIDKAERQEALKKVQEIMLDACVDIPVSWKFTLFAHQDYVHDMDWTVNDEIRLGDTWVSQ